MIQTIQTIKSSSVDQNHTESQLSVVPSGSLKLKTPAFSFIRSGRTDLGIT
jgi:hypothetical protein